MPMRFSVAFVNRVVKGKASRLLTGKLASAWPPTLSTQTVATTMANHKRSARAGSIILV
jgi:hypothetical protein